MVLLWVIPSRAFSSQLMFNLTYVLTFYPASYLANILTFYLLYILTFYVKSILTSGTLLYVTCYLTYILKFYRHILIRVWHEVQVALCKDGWHTSWQWFVCVCVLVAARQVLLKSLALKCFELYEKCEVLTEMLQIKTWLHQHVWPLFKRLANDCLVIWRSGVAFWNPK